MKNLLDRICKNNSCVVDDLAMYEFLWKKAFEYLHIGEYKNIYPYAYSAAYIIRNSKYNTYNSLVNKAFVEKNEDELVNLYKMKPGVFVRNLDMLLRDEQLSNEVFINLFKEISDGLSTKLLISLWEFYQNRNDLSDLRMFMYRKGLSTLFYEREETRKSLDNGVVDEIIIIIENTLRKRFSSYDKLGNVYLSEDLKNYYLPNNNRNSSNGFKTVSFGSRIKLEANGNILRFFTHWKNSTSRVDVDLSLELYDDKYNYVSTVGWHNMAGGKKIQCYHSGDITSAPSGASEFIDLDYVEARSIARYAVICNAVYTGQDFKDIPECFSGVMVRSSFGKKGSVFDPRCVSSKFDLTQSGSNLNVALAVDLKNLELIWLDIPKNNMYCYVVARDCNEISYSLRKVNQKMMSIYDLVMLHRNRFTLVQNKEDADFVIDLDLSSNLNPYSLDKISNEWL